MEAETLAYIKNRIESLQDERSEVIKESFKKTADSEMLFRFLSRLGTDLVDLKYYFEHPWLAEEDANKGKGVENANV